MRCRLNRLLPQSKFLPRDLGDYRGWIKSSQIAMAKKAGEDARMPEASILKLVSAVITSPLSDKDVEDSLGSQEGQLHFLWLICRKEQPNLTEAAFMAAVEEDFATGMEGVRSALMTIDTREPDEGEDGPENPTGQTPPPTDGEAQPAT